MRQDSLTEVQCGKRSQTVEAQLLGSDPRPEMYWVTCIGSVRLILRYPGNVYQSSG